MQVAPLATFLQARMSSSRFPGKVLAPFLGRPLLAHVLDAIRLGLPDAPVAVLTSSEPSDDPLAAWLASQAVRCIRGPREDVVGRFLVGLEQLPCDWVLRICGDSPLLNPHVLARVAAQALAAGPEIQLVTTIAPRTFPKGLNAEAIRASALKGTRTEPLDNEDKEHVTRWFHRNPTRYRALNVTSGNPGLSKLSMVVDEVSDLKRLEAMAGAERDAYARTPFWERPAR